MSAVQSPTVDGPPQLEASRSHIFRKSTREISIQQLLSGQLFTPVIVYSTTVQNGMVWTSDPPQSEL
jgi:hypothetical protein